MRWVNGLTIMIERLARALCAGLFLRVGPCHFEFEIDRRASGGAIRG